MNFVTISVIPLFNNKTTVLHVLQQSRAILEMGLQYVPEVLFTRTTQTNLSRPG